MPRVTVRGLPGCPGARVHAATGARMPCGIAAATHCRSVRRAGRVDGVVSSRSAERRPSHVTPLPDRYLAITVPFGAKPRGA